MRFTLAGSAIRRPAESVKVRCALPMEGTASAATAPKPNMRRSIMADA
jgi:hypothetical protein